MTDIGKVRTILTKQYQEALDSVRNETVFQRIKNAKYHRAIEQLAGDILALDAIMARNFGMAYNKENEIYE